MYRLVSSLPPKPLCLAPGCLLLFQKMGAFLNGMHHIGTILAEALSVERFDEGTQRQLPRSLVGVIELAKFPGIHAEFACHLHMRVGEAVALTCCDPYLQVIGNTSRLRGHVG